MVKIRNGQDVARLLREVNTLSRMHHENIVRYYQAWIEERAPKPRSRGVSRPGSSGGSPARRAAAGARGIGRVGNGRGGVAERVTVGVGGVDALGDIGGFGVGGGAKARGLPRDVSNVSWDIFDRSGSDAADDGGWDDEYEGEESESEEESDDDESEGEEEEEDDDDEASTVESSAQRSARAEDGWLHRRSPRTSSAPEGTALGWPAGAAMAPSGRASAASSKQGARKRRGGRRRVLFIQMEYCHRTLHDILGEGVLPEEKIWRLLRQLLGGLQHVHSQGITHRDLKPKNIFVDFGENIKLGDFGLASGDLAERAGEVDAAPAADGAATGAPSAHGGAPAARNPEDLSSAHTADVGTLLYMDPHWHGRHSYAFDMWSLGIVLYELCNYFPTAMERVIALADLRRDGPPASFEAVMPSQASLIRAMMHADSSQRPAAREVLASASQP